MKTNTAGSAAALGTAGGMRDTTRSSPGTWRRIVLSPSTQAPYFGAPQSVTNMVRMIHGRAARKTTLARPALTPRDRCVTSSSFALRIRFGFQTRRNSTRAVIVTTEAMMSTNHGPCNRAIINWVKAKVTPATKIAGQTSSIALKPA